MTDVPSYSARPQAPTAGRGPRFAPPVRRTVASFTDYAQAEQLVDRLADRDFPVGRTAIVGHDLRTVEQVLGKLDYPLAAWRGLVSGAVPGALIGWLYGLFAWVTPLVAGFLLALYGLVIGAVIGALVGLAAHALQRGRRDFASVTVTQPGRFEVVADDEVADEALRLLQSNV